MPTFQYELTTPLSVDKSEVMALLQDPKRFLIAGGGTEESSIRFDDSTNKWLGTSKSGIPMLPKPDWCATFEKTTDGSHWIIEAGMGVVTEHTWNVEGATGGEVSYVTEKASLTAPFIVFHAAKWKMPSLQKETHANIQDFLS